MRLVPLFLILSLIFSAQAVAESLSPEKSRKIESLRIQAMKFFEAKEYGKAIPILKEMLSLNPADKSASKFLQIAEMGNVEPYCKQGATAFVSGDYSKSMEFWKRVKEANPLDKRADDLLELSSAMVQDTTLDKTYAMAEKLYKEKKYDQAISELEKVLLMRPNEEKARSRIAVIKAAKMDDIIQTHFDNSEKFLEAQDFDGAILELESIISLKPGDDRAVNMLFAVQKSKKDTSIKKHLDKAEEYLKNTEYDLAIAEWKNVLKIDETNETALRQIALVQKSKLEGLYKKASDLYERGFYAESRDLYIQLEKENSTDTEIKKTISKLNEVTSVVMKVDKTGKVWDIVRKSLKYHIAVDDNATIAVASIWYASELEPGNITIQAIRDFMEKVHISAIRSMDYYPKRDSTIIDYYLFAAVNHIYDGRFDRAIADCQLIIELEPNNILALKRLGSAYFAMKRKDKAREAWLKALTLDPEDDELKKFIDMTGSSKKKPEEPSKSADKPKPKKKR